MAPEQYKISRRL